MERTTMVRRIASALFLMFVLSCAGMPAKPGMDVRNILSPTGKLRIGVYPGSPTSMIRDPVSGEVKGVTVDLGMELAQRLGVPYALVEYRRIEEVLEAMRSGLVDFTVTNATAARALFVDFTQPILAMELGYLVPQGSSVSSVDRLDRAGIRVGVTQGSTSERTLPGLLKNASVIPAPSLKAAVEMLSQHKLDAFATNKAILFEMSDALPGSRVLDARWGLEQLAIAVPKGREQAMAFMRTFAHDAASQDMVGRSARKAGLRGSIKAE